MKKDSHSYLHATSLEQKEARRLALLNQAYSPKTHEILNKHLKPNSSVLELAVGTGETAKYFVDKIKDNGCYVGVDNSLQQLEQSKKHISQSANVHFVKADVTLLSESSDLKNIKPDAGFDLIYCRWLLCHIPANKRPSVIQQIISLLSPGGVFICEEPDFRNMHLIKAGQQVENSSIDAWKKTVKLLQKKLGINLEMDAAALLNLFENSIVTKESELSYKIIDSFQAELHNEQKQSLCLGIETSRKAVEEIAGIAPEENNKLLDELRKIAEDPNLSIAFYDNTFASITRNHLKP